MRAKILLAAIFSVVIAVVMTALTTPTPELTALSQPPAARTVKPYTARINKPGLDDEVLTKLSQIPSVEAASSNIELMAPKPLSQVLSLNLKPVQSGTLQIPMITWGGDVATILAEMEGTFRDEGLQVKLFTENDFAKQCQSVIDGKTPLLRGTIGMINACADAVNKAGTDLVVVYQLTWSNGGDTMVVRNNVRKPGDLKDKVIALQLYGPHMDYVANIMSGAGVSMNQVKFKWLKELTLPTYDTRGKIVDPVSAFVENDSFDAVMAIIPDALALTSGGEVGTGAEGSVEGAKILLTTKTASRIIADVYAVRKDYFDANRKQVQAFVHGLLRGEEALRDLLANKNAQQARYQQLLAKSADLLLGAPQASADVEALLGDAEFVGYAGNVAFFTGLGTTRNLQTLTKEIQTAFVGMGLMSARVRPRSGNWDYAALASGLKYAQKVSAAKPKFDEKRVAQKIEQIIDAEPTKWEEEGTLFVVEINFAPNQSTFTTAQYADDFKKALEISQTYGGALVVIEGHSDPLGILKERKRRANPTIIAQKELAAKNLSLMRARAVREVYLDYTKSEGLAVDESQFVAVGMGIKSPKFNPPRTKEEWSANRRVVFRVKQVEAELEEFVPLGD